MCNNTNVSKLVFDFIAGWEKQIGEKTIAQAGQLPIFRNDDGNGAWLHRPNTVLVDSQQLESGESMSDDFKAIAAREITLDPRHAGGQQALAIRDSLCCSGIDMQGTAWL